MSEGLYEERLLASIDAINAYLPRAVYLSVGDMASKALLREVVYMPTNQSKIGLLLNYRGKEYDNLCSLGKQMRTDLWETYDQLSPTESKTFDGWHKIKIIISGEVLRLKTFIPPEVRAGTEEARMEWKTTQRRQQLVSILRGPEHYIIDGTDGFPDDLYGKVWDPPSVEPSSKPKREATKPQAVLSSTRTRQSTAILSKQTQEASIDVGPLMTILRDVFPDVTDEAAMSELFIKLLHENPSKAHFIIGLA